MYLTLSAYMCLQYTFKDEEKNESYFIAFLQAKHLCTDPNFCAVAGLL